LQLPNWLASVGVGERSDTRLTHRHCGHIAGCPPPTCSSLASMLPAVDCAKPCAVTLRPWASAAAAANTAAALTAANSAATAAATTAIHGRARSTGT
jgi:hypothetical protein